MPFDDSKAERQQMEREHRRKVMGLPEPDQPPMQDYSHSPDSTITSAEGMTSVLVIIAILIALYFRIDEQASKFVNWVIRLCRQKNQAALETVGALAVLTFGWVLYLFKKHYQKQYGVAEIFVSILSCIYTIQTLLQGNKENTILSLSITFMTAVYFTQRGVNNYFDGRDKERAKKAKAQQLPEKPLAPESTTAQA